MSARSQAVWSMVDNLNRPDRVSCPPATTIREFESSRATRRVGFGRRVSATHQLLMTSTGRVAVCESALEGSFASIFDVDPTIVDIEEQAPAVKLAGEQAKEHWPDFRLTFVDGTRLVVAVKPDDLAEKKDFVSFVYELGRACAKLDYADGGVWLGNRHLDTRCLQNADTIRFARQCQIDGGVIAEVKAFLSGRQHTRIQDVLDIHPSAPEAAWLAVADGLVEPSTATPRLDHNTILVPPKARINQALRIDFGAVMRAQRSAISSLRGGSK